MDLEPLVLFGAGSQVYVLDEIIRKQNLYIAAIFNDSDPNHRMEFPAEVIVGQQKIREWIKRSGTELRYAISIGNHHGNARVKRHQLLQELGLIPAHLQHETAFVSRDAVIGSACQLLAFSFVGAKARLGEAVIINTKASVDHECILQDGVHVGPGATIAGRVTIGRNTFVGSGATICPDLHIVDNCIIGAGAVVVSNLTIPATYVGVPARRLMK